MKADIRAMAQELGWNTEHEMSMVMLERFAQEVARICAEIALEAEPYRSEDLIKNYFGVKE